MDIDKKQFNDNGWDKYGKLVLNEITRLSNNLNDLSFQIQDIKQEIIELKAIQEKINDIGDWKLNISKIVSVNQLNEMIKEIEELKNFRTKATTIFTITQFIISTAIVLLSMFLK